ncbi:MAG: protein kinase [Polyangiaceae bacterium]
MTTETTSNAPAPGTMLAGKYRVERVIGEGGMGVVVEAKHLALDERVAMKFLTAGYAQHPEATARFLREARAAVKIKSEHVARVSDVGTLESGAPYMVMELLQGRDLSRELQVVGPLPMQDAVDYVIQACDAIAEAHAAGIVHRDLKPANLFLARRMDGSPLVKVLDFGISKMQESGVENLTKTMTAMGSALYMSPEQMAQTRGVDHRTDIYALGVALYELLAGKQPYYADTLPQLCAEVLTGTPTPLATVRSDLPPGLAHVLEKAYARDRANRYQTIAHFVVALAPFAPSRSQPVIERIARVASLPVPTAGAPAAPAALPIPAGGPLLGGGTIAMDAPIRPAPPLHGGTVAIDAPAASPGVSGAPPAAPSVNPHGTTSPSNPGVSAPVVSVPPADSAVPAASTQRSAEIPGSAPATAPNMVMAVTGVPAPSSKLPVVIGAVVAVIGIGVAAYFATRPTPTTVVTAAETATVAPAQTVTVAPAQTATVAAPAQTAEAPATPPTSTVAAGTTAKPTGTTKAAAAGTTKPGAGKGKSIFDDR